MQDPCPTMPVSPIIDKQGNQFYYVDTGELEGSYLTVVLVHGTSMHGGMYLVFL